ncbi:MAG TPA: hypothetical protein DCS93_19300 [Microscillaceae bacterium]|nr:hypothetical protein [Microscillaceae bacterium]
MFTQNSGSTKNSKRTMNLKSATGKVSQLMLYALLGSMFLVLGGATIVSKPKVKPMNGKLFTRKVKPVLFSTANNPNADVCQGSTVTIPDIVITESANADFTGNSSVNIEIGSDFTFGGTVTATIGGTAGASTISASVSGGTLTLTYSFTAGSETQANTITISGLEVTASASATTGNQFLRVTGDALGVTTSDDLATVNVQAKPATPGTIIGGNEIFPGESTVLIVPPVAGADGYLWDFGGSDKVSGTSDVNYITINTTAMADNITASETVTVTVRAVDKTTSCTSDVSSDFTLTIKPRGILVNKKSPTSPVEICNDGSVVTLDNIVLTEQFFADFGVNNGSFDLELSNDSFVFDQTAGNPTVSFTNSSGGTFSATVNGTKLTISYNNTDGSSLTKLNSLIISGVGVKVNNTTQSTATLQITGVTDAHLEGLTRNLPGGDVLTVERLARPPQPTAIEVDDNTGVTAFCTNTTVKLDVDGSRSAANRSYDWKLPSGISITSADPNSKEVDVTVSSSAVAGDIEVTVTNTNTGCVSLVRSLTITVSTGLSPTAQPTGLSGEADICIGTSVLYSVNPIFGADGYEWNFPADKFSAVGTDGTDFTDLDPGATTTSRIKTTSNFIRLQATGDGSPDLTVKGITNGCGDGAFSLPYSITVKPAATIVIESATPGETFTEGQAFTTDGGAITLRAIVNGATNPSEGSFSGNGISGNTFNPANAALGENTITYTYNDPTTLCASRAQVNVIIAQPSGVPGTQAEYCEGDPVVETINIETLLSTTGTNTGRYIVALQEAPGLSGPTRNSFPSCDPNANLPAAGVTQTYTFRPSSVPVSGAVTEVPIYAYVVTKFQELILLPIDPIDPFDPLRTTLSPDPVISRAASFDCSVSRQLLGTIKINRRPTPNIVISSANADVCGNNSTEYTYQVQTPVSGNTYTWEILTSGDTPEPTYGTFVGGNTGEEVTVKWAAASVGQMPKIRVTETNGASTVTCDGTDSESINVQAGPGLSLAVDGGGTLFCTGIEVDYTVTVTSGTPSGAYTWTIADGIGTIESTSGNTAKIIWLKGNGAGQGVLRVSAQNSLNCEGFAELPVDIDPASEVVINGSEVVCANSPGGDYSIDANDNDDVIWEVKGGTIVTSGSGTLTVGTDGTNTLTGKGIDSKLIQINWGDGEIGQVKATKSTASACNGVNIKSVTITPQPKITSITNLETAYCDTQADVTLTPVIENNPTGTFSYALYRIAAPTNNISSTFISGHTINLTTLYGSSTTEEEYILEYTFTDDNTGCSKTETYNFKIVPQPTVSFTFAGAKTEFCVADNQVELSPNLTGGTFSVTKFENPNTTATNETFGPFNATTINFSDLNGAGKYRVEYNLTLGSCSSSSGTQEFQIFDPTTVTIDMTSINATGYCVRGYNNTLQTVIPGDVIDLSVNTALNGIVPGTSITSTIDLIDGTNRFFEIKRDGAPDTDYEPLRDNGGALSRSFNAGRPLFSQPNYAHDNAAITTAQWNVLAGTYQVRYNYTDGKGCKSVSAPIDIIVKPLPLINFAGVSASEAFCADLTSVTLEPLVNGNPPAAAAGTATFIIVDTDNPLAAPRTITGPSFNLDPSDLGEGNYTIQLRFEETNGCAEFSEVRSFIVNGNPAVGFSLGNPPVNGNKYCISGITKQIELVPDGGQTGGTFTIQKDGGSRVISLGAGVTIVSIDALEGTGKYNVTYDFVANGCSGQNTITNVFEIVPLPTLDITGIDPAGYCAQGATPFALQPRVNLAPLPVSEPATQNGFFEIKKVSGENPSSDFVALVDPNTGDSTDIFNPARPFTTDPVLAADAPTSAWNALAGDYRVRYKYKDENGCENTSPEFTITINRTPKLTFTGLDATYCDDVELVTLTPFDGESRITSSVTFKYRNTSQTTFNTFTQGNSFSPKTLGAGTYEIVLESSASGCTNSSQRDTTYLVTIQPTPKNVTLTATQTFGENKIQFVAGADNTNTNWTWEWDFRDGTTSNQQNPLKTLINIAPQVVNYTFIPGTEQGCTKLIEKSFKMEFDVENLCVGAATKFNNKSELPRDEIGSVLWDFGDGLGTSTETSPSYSYTTPGTYIVKLTMTTKDGIATYVLNRRVDIFPLIPVSDTDFYNEEFENGSGGWISHGVVSVNQIPLDSTSWKLKQPDGFLIRNSTGNAWVTDNRDNLNRASTDANYNSNEQSYVESPCFDIGGLNKPMISFRYWSDTDAGSDGVTLLYTIDDGKTWTRLGEKDLGINWFDTRPILGAPGEGSSTATINANPGNEGWSGQSQTTAGEWKTARFSLTSVLIAMQGQGITNRVVRFRIAFGSNADNPPGQQFDGFAFDGVRISNRNRIVLLEYFINASVNNAGTFDLNARKFPDDGNNNEVVSIHNHTDFPGVDDINTQNDKDPSARAFYHGVRDVPRGVVDGTARDEVLGKWATDLFADRTLIPSPFLITINQPTVTGNQLNVSASIQAIEAFDRKVVMHVVVIDSVTNANGQTFHNATRKFLPDAAGTYRDTPWVTGDVQTLSFDWDFADLDPSKFRIVVFIEDYDTREVHQAGVLSVNGNRQGTGGGTQLGQVTGGVDPLPDSKLVLYPNPTSDYLQVKLETQKPLSNQAYWEIITIQGQIVKSGAWAFNQPSKSVNTSNLAQGIYILRIIDEGRIIQRRFRKKD